MATFPSKVNFVTGDILTATNMNDVGGAINLLDGAQYAGGKNRVLNSNFSVWQRGTSMAGSATAFCSDRWNAWRAAAGSTFSRQTTSDTTNLPNIQYCVRVQRDSGNTGTGVIILNQNFESVNSIPLAGKTIVFSFYARAGANYSSASSGLLSQVSTGTGTDQSYVTTGYTGEVTLISQTATLTTTWQRFTYSATVAANVTEMSVQWRFTPVGTASTNDYFEVTGVQLEAANTASPFQTATGTIQGELAACQRYYQKSYAQGTTVPTNAQFVGVISGPGTSTLNNANFGFVKLPVVMRTAPTVTTYSYTSSTTSAISNGAGTDQGASSGVAAGIGDGGFSINNNSGGTITTTNGWLIHYQASAEL